MHLIINAILLTPWLSVGFYSRGKSRNIPHKLPKMYDLLSGIDRELFNTNRVWVQIVCEIELRMEYWLHAG